MGEIFRQERSGAELHEHADARIARLHRYYVARQFCHGRDVLDLDGGDGSGPAVLAQAARSVRAVVADVAAAAAFTAGALAFTPEPGSGAAEFDVVIAFDLIEREAEPDGWLAGLHRRLRPGGVLLVATPDGDRGFTPAPGPRQRTFGGAELLDLLGRYFPHVELFGQRGFIGSALFRPVPTGALLVVEHRDLIEAETSSRLPRPDALLCVASDTALAPADSLLIDSDIATLAAWQARAVQAGAVLATVTAERDALVAQLDHERCTDARWREQLAILRVSAAASDTRYRQATAAYEAEQQQYFHVLAAIQADLTVRTAQWEQAEQRARSTSAWAEEAVRQTQAHAEQRIQATQEHSEQRIEAAQSHADRRLAASDNHVANLEAELKRLRHDLRQANMRAAAAATIGIRQWLGWPLRALRRPAGPDPAVLARVAAIRSHPMFDAAWYLERNPDVLSAGADAAVHYVASGSAEGRSPGPSFDAAWYAAEHPEAQSADVTLLEFHERHGRGAGWPTEPPPPLLLEHTDVAAEPDATIAEETKLAASAITAIMADDAVVADEPDAPDDVTEPGPAPPALVKNPAVLYVSGEADTPGSQYRCVRYAAAARDAGWSADWRRLEDVTAAHLTGVEIVVLWRVRWSRHVANIEHEVRSSGGTVVFDVDDLMFRPELARVTIIDGMRTTNAGISQTRETFAQVQEAMASADMCTTTTEELADHMREWQKATYVLPNGFDAATHARSRAAVRARRRGADDGLLRIGYAAGTMTHQKDFLTALPGLVRVLQARAQVRLVLFRAKGGNDLVLVDEFDELLPHVDRIEWRDSVTLDELPSEMARFDINIAPLEPGNPFCEAKSELKFFEAALVDVPTVASPTGPFARAIEHGCTGMLAGDAESWFDMLLRLVDDADLRAVIGRNAYVACVWPFGPQRRAELVGSFLEQIRGTAAGARDFALQVLQTRRRAAPPPPRPPATTVHHRDMLEDAAVTVIIPCYNYADYIIEALESVRVQTLPLLDLVVIDDCSTDPLCIDLIMEWVRRHEARFNRLLVLRHVENAGLSAARNSGFHAAETGYVLPLDADNRLHPECCGALLASLRHTNAAYAYPSIRQFHADDAVFCNERYQPMRFVGGNYIDAMAMIGKWAWAAAGGYDMPRHMGWEDFDLWCRLAELGQRGVHVDRVLAEYRVHGGSMLDALVEVDRRKEATVALVEQRHDWLRLSSRKPFQRV